ncbi:cupin domain-containing protein [uncultured Jatrophihabitans sp.]|uniref:cupin domain-containing protein n=1 Tax=uncultured Jatrophihabitans sp. TaxID=1610747 RepID=UPI0035CADA33
MTRRASDAAPSDLGMGRPVSAVNPVDLDPVDLDMRPHPEGGWYRETWRHEATVDTPRGPRPLSTCVAFLLEPGQRSAWHRVASAELWLWQGGGPLLLTVGGFDDAPVPGFSCELRAGGQYLVRPDEWQSAAPAGGEAVLVACVVSPGFDFADFTLAAGDAAVTLAAEDAAAGAPVRTEPA